MGIVRAAVSERCASENGSAQHRFLVFYTFALLVGDLVSCTCGCVGLSGFAIWSPVGVQLGGAYQTELGTKLGMPVFT